MACFHKKKKKTKKNKLLEHSYAQVCKYVYGWFWAMTAEMSCDRDSMTY